MDKKWHQPTLLLSLLLMLPVLVQCTTRLERTPRIIATSSSEISPTGDINPHPQQYTKFITSTPSLSIPTFTSIPTIGPTETKNIPMGSPLILQYTLGGEIFLQDIRRGVVRSLDPMYKIYNSGDFRGWSRGGCAFLIREPDSYDIVEIDLQGKLLRTVFSSKVLSYNGNGKVSPYVLLSPSDNWAAFYVADGNIIEHPVRGAHYEKENLMVISSSGDQGPFQISKRGGAWVYQWAPDSTHIAYSDYDLSGQFQIFVSDYQVKSRTQVTKFIGEDLPPNEISWSPNSEFLVLVYWLDGGAYSLKLISKGGGQIISFENVDYFWWKENSFLYLWIGDEIHWIDPYKYNVINKIPRVPKLQANVNQLGDRNQLGCFIDCFGQKTYGLIAFDVDKREFIQYPNTTRILDMAGWRMTPRNFSGEDSCK